LFGSNCKLSLKLIVKMFNEEFYWLFFKSIFIFGYFYC
jgi:hypothetical protein